MHILILGNDSDREAAYLKSRLETMGAQVNYWDSQQFPRELRLTWRPHIHEGLLRLPAGQVISLNNIHSIFWRILQPINVPLLPDLVQHQVAVADSISVLRSLIRSCPARWINSWEAYQFHQEKPLQLAAVKELGVTIPKTLISNDPEQVRAFAAAIPKLIFKPVYQGPYTRFLEDFHLEQPRLNQALQLSPITLQEHIPGTNIRCYVVGQEVYAAEIRSTYLDFREDSQAQYIPAILPEAVQLACLSIAQALFLEWTAIDWRLSSQGEFIFLKADPNPMFMDFEQLTGFPIAEKLVQLLTG